MTTMAPFRQGKQIMYDMYSIETYCNLRRGRIGHSPPLYIGTNKIITRVKWMNKIIKT